MSEPNILFWDVETAPLFGCSWRTWDTRILDVTKDWYMLCYSYKWKGERGCHVKSLKDYPKYKSENDNEDKLIKDLWRLLDEADILVHHNGDKFDLKKANAKFLEYGLPPYSPVRTIDTLKQSRKHFAFTSNKLDDLAKKLGVGAKVQHTGINLWLGCMAGDDAAWKLMTKYAKQDTILLEKVYDKLQPWMDSTNLGLYVEDSEMICPKCGHDHLTIAGKSATNSGVYLRYRCKKCGGYSRARNKIKGSGNPLRNT